jgi:hypothetical protein
MVESSSAVGGGVALDGGDVAALKSGDAAPPVEVVAALPAQNETTANRVDSLAADASAAAGAKTDAPLNRDNLYCPISKLLMKDPVVASDGHTYERSNIEDWLKQGNTASPVDGQSFTTRDVFPNHGLNSIISHWESHQKQSTSGEMGTSANENDEEDDYEDDVFEDDSDSESWPASYSSGKTSDTDGSDDGKDKLQQEADKGEESSSHESASDNDALRAPRAMLRGIWSFSVGKMVDDLGRHASWNVDESNFSTRDWRDRAMELDALEKNQWVAPKLLSVSDDPTSYYVLEIERPAELSPVYDECMLVWFNEGSKIASKTSAEDVGVSMTRSGPDDIPRVAFYEYSTDAASSSGRSKQHASTFGRTLLQKEGRRLVETNLRPARMHGKLRHSFLGFNGTPGDDLPSIEAPLFVRGSLRCLMAVYSPVGYEQPSFTVSACYTSTPPLRLFRTRFMRAFNWTCNVLIFMCTCCIILLEAYTAYALLVFIFVVLVQVTGNGVSKLYWKGYYKGYDYSDALHTGQFGQQVCSQWRKCRRLLLFSSKAPRKVQPVVAASTRTADDDSSASSDTSSDEQPTTSGSSDSDGADQGSNRSARSKSQALQRGSGTRRSGRREDDDEDEDVESDEDKDEVSDDGADGFDDDDDLDDKYLPRKEIEVDPFLKSYVERVLKKQVRKMHHNIVRHGDPMMEIATELSEVACRGRIGAKQCATVLARHSSDTIGLRFRTKEVSEDLDHACKTADRKAIKKNLVKDIIHGARFGGNGRTEDEEAWSGLDAFRHIFEDEVREAEGTFDAILHSILDASIRDPG